MAFETAEPALYLIVGHDPEHISFDLESGRQEQEFDGKAISLEGVRYHDSATGEVTEVFGDFQSGYAVRRTPWPGHAEMLLAGFPRHLRISHYYGLTESGEEVVGGYSTNGEGDALVNVQAAPHSLVSLHLELRRRLEGIALKLPRVETGLIGNPMADDLMDLKLPAKAGTLPVAKLARSLLDTNLQQHGGKPRPGFLNPIPQATEGMPLGEFLRQYREALEPTDLEHSTSNLMSHTFTLRPAGQMSATRWERKPLRARFLLLLHLGWRLLWALAAIGVPVVVLAKGMLALRAITAQRHLRAAGYGHFDYWAAEFLGAELAGRVRAIPPMDELGVLPEVDLYDARSIAALMHRAAGGRRGRR